MIIQVSNLFLTAVCLQMWIKKNKTKIAVRSALTEINTE